MRKIFDRPLEWSTILKNHKVLQTLTMHNMPILTLVMGGGGAEGPPLSYISMCPGLTKPHRTYGFMSFPKIWLGKDFIKKIFRKNYICVPWAYSLPNTVLIYIMRFLCKSMKMPNFNLGLRKNYKKQSLDILHGTRSRPYLSNAYVDFIENRGLKVWWFCKKRIL